MSGDSGYDSHESYELIAARGVNPVIPPRKDAVISQHGNSSLPVKRRDEVIRNIRALGRKNWKKQSGYHKRSLAETAMYRLKTIFESTILMAQDLNLDGAKLPSVNIELLQQRGAVGKPVIVEPSQTETKSDDLPSKFAAIQKSAAITFRKDEEGKGRVSGIVPASSETPRVLLLQQGNAQQKNAPPPPLSASSAVKAASLPQT